jgi:hypothetical protein
MSTQLTLLLIYVAKEEFNLVYDVRGISSTWGFTTGYEKGIIARTDPGIF